MCGRSDIRPSHMGCLFLLIILWFLRQSHHGRTTRMLQDKAVLLQQIRSRTQSFSISLLPALLRLGIRIIDHAFANQPRHADGNRIGFIVAGIIPLADKLRERRSNLGLFGGVIASHQFLDSLWRYLSKLALTESIGIKIGDADNLVKNFNS